MNSHSRVVRRGLPRTSGGAPWPPARALTGAGAAGDPGAVAGAAHLMAANGSAPTAVDGCSRQVRRGLPRTPGGEQWPPARELLDVMRPPAVALASSAAAEAGAGTAAAPDAAFESDASDTLATSYASSVLSADTRGLTAQPMPIAPPILGSGRGYFALRRLATWFALIGAATLACGIAVIFARWLLGLDAVRDFVALHPGEYHLPEGAPVGLPAWLGWQHFFNAFFMVLIIRSGIQVRRERKPPFMWVSKWSRPPKRKISITLWFHQALDALWLVNGLIFVVLLFATGQWLRIVPSSWEVFPNALSALLQYASLDWPTENGWVNYNSLQQLAYFSTVFIAAPLATATGFRMSSLWPARAPLLDRMCPMSWARRVHFPVMVYFVAFIVTHIGLVFSTGALRNLNHMYAASGSVDPNEYADNWSGFVVFVVSVAVMLSALLAARPLFLAPVARLFGSVSSR